MLLFDMLNRICQSVVTADILTLQVKPGAAAAAAAAACHVLYYWSLQADLFHAESARIL
jgi:hypothetical protein